MLPAIRRRQQPGSRARRCPLRPFCNRATHSTNLLLQFYIAAGGAGAGLVPPLALHKLGAGNGPLQSRAFVEPEPPSPSQASATPGTQRLRDTAAAAAAAQGAAAPNYQPHTIRINPMYEPQITPRLAVGVPEITPRMLGVAPLQVRLRTPTIVPGALCTMFALLLQLSAPSIPEPVVCGPQALHRRPRLRIPTIVLGAQCTAPCNPASVVDDEHASASGPWPPESRFLP